MIRRHACGLANYTEQNIHTCAREVTLVHAIHDQMLFISLPTCLLLFPTSHAGTLYQEAMFFSTKCYQLYGYDKITLLMLLLHWRPPHNAFVHSFSFLILCTKYCIVYSFSGRQLKEHSKLASSKVVIPKHINHWGAIKKYRLLGSNLFKRFKLNPEFCTLLNTLADCASVFVGNILCKTLYHPVLHCYLCSLI